jgi:hypothetical protein
MTCMRLWASVSMFILLGLFAAQEAYPWGDIGHEIICEIAFQELTPRART